MNQMTGCSSRTDVPDDRILLFREPMYLCTCVSEKGGEGEVVCSETPSLLSYILIYVSFAEVGRICRAVLREPIHLCTCVSAEGS